MRALSDLADDRRKIEGAILTTYPFDTEFYEGAVRRIVSRKRGIGSDTVVLTDSSMYLETFEREVTPRYAGRSYYLSPVSVDGRRVFHPKVFFFGGEKRAYCFVGSANLTQRGLTDNAELWSSFDCENSKVDDLEESAQKQLLVLRDLRRFLSEFLDTEYTDMIGEDSFETASQTLESCEWLEEKAAEVDVDRRTHVLHNLETSILNQVFEYVETEVEKVSVVAPYFGETSRVLEEIRDRGQGEFEIELYLQQDKAQFDREELSDWLERNDSSLTIFKNPRFVHGKMLRVETESQSLCLTGSPNPSIKGMLTSAESGGNVEVGVLRRATPGYFKDIFEDEIVGDVVGEKAKEFRPSPEPSVEDKPTSGQTAEQDFVLTDAVYSSEAALEGDTLKIRLSEVPGNKLDDAKVVARSETGPGKFEIRFEEGEVEADEREGGVSSVEFRIDSEDDADTLSSPCRVVVETDDTTSNPRWLAHESSDLDESVRQEAEEGGTVHTPDHVHELFTSEGERRTEILHAVEAILEGIDDLMGGTDDGNGDERENGGNDGRRGKLPPDWTMPTPISDVSVEEVVPRLYRKWTKQTKRMSTDADEDVSAEALCQDFSRFVAATNRTTLHLMALQNRSGREYEEFKPGDLVEWKAYRDMYYAKDGATVKELKSHLVERESNVESEAESLTLEDICGLLHENILPQVVLTYLISKNEEDGSRRQDHHFEWTYSAAAECLSRGYPKPRHCTPESVSQVEESVRETVEEVTESHKESTAESIEKRYLKDNAVRDAVLELYADSIVRSGPKSLRGFYNGLYCEIRDDREFLENIRSVAPRLSAMVSKHLQRVGNEDPEAVKEYIAVLDEMEKKWSTETKKDYEILEYARLEQ